MIKTWLNFIKKLYTYRSSIWAMAVRDIQARYIGTVAGIFWSVINPLAFMLVYWIVFSVGLKVELAEGVPFIIVFMCGLIPWMMFSEILTTSLNSINANAHLIKKTVFPSEILPVVSLVTSWFTHGIMMVLLFILMAFNQIPFSINNFGFLYYFLALSVFALGLGWLFSSLNVFFRDIGQFLNVLINLWFWLTPIAWPLKMLPVKYQFLIKLNPMCYVIQGYKQVFISRQLPLSHPGLTDAYFWIGAGLVFLIGGYVFKRLKAEFAEVL